jgi:hypothetical protein
LKSGDLMLRKSGEKQLRKIGDFKFAIYTPKSTPVDCANSLISLPAYAS